MTLTSPRFDTWWQVVANFVSLAVFAVAAGRFLWSWRRGRRPRLRDLLLLVNVSVSGVYLPVFALWWLWMEKEEEPVDVGVASERVADG